MIHLVYPYDPGSVAAPWTIGNHLAAGLRRAGYTVRQYQWDEKCVLRPASSHDILLGHPHPEPGYVFAESALRGGWGRVVAMTPWGGEDLTRRMIDGLLDHLHHTVLICGPYWAERVPADWEGLCTCVDMAINPADFEPLKPAFNPPGQRKFLYIGCTLPSKGTDLLGFLASGGSNGDAFDAPHISHLGVGSIPGCHELGHWPDLRHPGARSLIAKHDYVLCPGVNDANPTTALEAIAWGLVPICARTAGWRFDGLPYLPRDAKGAVNMVEHLQFVANPETLYATVRPALNRYTWERFVAAVNKVLQPPE